MDPKHEAVQELKRVAATIRHVPTRNFWRNSKPSRISADTIIKLFGTWAQAIQAAGISPGPHVPSAPHLGPIATVTNPGNYLIISDTQMPFENPKALSFCAYLKSHFKIPDDNVLHAGDELDEYFASLYKKDPNARHTPTSELMESIEKMRQWYDVFPKCKVAISNHGVRWWTRAQEADIPDMLLRTYRDVIEAPVGWQWARRWDIDASRKPFTLIHGMGYSGQNGHRTAAIDLGRSVAIGHLHSHAGTAQITTEGRSIWGMNTGCLIAPEEYAFHYGLDSRFKPSLGCGIVVNGGTTPIWMPLE